MGCKWSSLNNLNIDPLTAVAATVAVTSFVGKQIDKGKEKKARKEYMAEVGAIGDDLMERYDEFMGYQEDMLEEQEELQDKADQFMPGGEFYDMAYQQAVDTAFLSAEKGKETLASQGIDLSYYGSSTMHDIVKADYTETFTKDYMDFAQVGVQLEGVGAQYAGIAAQYAGMGKDLLGSYASLMSGAAQVDYMGKASQTSLVSDVASSVSTGAQIYAMGGGFKKPE